MNKKTISHFLIFSIVLILSGCTSQEFIIESDAPPPQQQISESSPSAKTKIDIAKLIKDKEPIKSTSLKLTNKKITQMEKMDYDLNGVLTKLNKSKPEGSASATFQDDIYFLLVNIDNLSKPEDGSYYEGWLLNPDSQDIISTGKVKRNSQGQYQDAMQTKDDLTPYTLYLLTQETDDQITPGEIVLSAKFLP